MTMMKGQYTLRLNVYDYAKIRKIAKEDNRSTANMIETLIKQKIREYEKENGEIELSDEEIYPE